MSQAIARMGGGAKNKREEEEGKDMGGWASLREKKSHVVGDISDTVSEISTTVSEITTNIATNISQNLSTKGSFSRSFSFASWGESKGRIRKAISPSSSERQFLPKASSMSSRPWPKRGSNKID